MRLPAALLLAALLATAQRRSEPRDQAASQRRQAPAAGESRSTAARRQFQSSNPCPSTHRTVGPCPGYVIDHVIALKRGGLDAPSNMQWQTIAEAKAKDKIE